MPYVVHAGLCMAPYETCSTLHTLLQHWGSVKPGLPDPVAGMQCHIPWRMCVDPVHAMAGQVGGAGANFAIL